MELLYITNEIKEAIKAEKAGVDIIFIDLEIDGKIERQGHLDTVISKHKLEDIKKIKKEITKAKILTRINPINKKSANEIEKAIEYGSDILMLPMFKTPEEVEEFIKLVNSRAETCLLLETSQAFCRSEDILKIKGIDRIHIGLNDLHLSLGLDFMFECLSCGIVDILIEKIKKYPSIKYGIGGIARIKEGLLPAEKILCEHIRLGSSAVILSRTFKRNDESFEKNIKDIREYWEKHKKLNKKQLDKNKEEVKYLVADVIKQIKER